jgi:hypothetical protein
MLTLAYHLVAYLDILGQGDELSKLEALPKTKAEEAETVAVVRNTAGRVRRIRKTFDELFEQFNQAPTQEFLATLPEQYRGSYPDLRRIRVVNRGISDSFIISVPLLESGQHPGIRTMGS